MKKYYIERKYDASREEEFFLSLLGANGYIVKGIIEKTTKTWYLIEKDGTQVEFDFHLQGGGMAQAKKALNGFEVLYNTTKEYNRMIKGE